jgi:hypothetical protein
LAAVGVDKVGKAAAQSGRREQEMIFWNLKIVKDDFGLRDIPQSHSRFALANL